MVLTYKREPQTANLTARHWSRDFLTFAVRGKCRKTSILRSLIGSSSNDDGNGNENVTRKYIFLSFVLLRDYFNSLNFYKNGEHYPGTKLVGVAFKLRKKMKNSPSCVHVLHKTLNVVISRCCFAENGKEMYQNVERTCRAIVFAH